MEGKIYLPIVDNGMQLVRSSYTLCLLNAMHRRPIAVEKISYPYPLGAMDIITNHFLKTDCERMLIIDGDMIFGRHDVDMILEHDADIVGAVYAKKVVGCELVMSALSDEWDNGENPLMEVEWVGRGFINIHRRVFEAMHPCETYQLGGETLNAYWESMPGGHSEDRGLESLDSGNAGLLMDDVRFVHATELAYPLQALAFSEHGSPRSLGNEFIGGQRNDEPVPKPSRHAE